MPLAQTARAGLHPGGTPLYTAMSVAVVTVFVPLGLERLIVGDDLVPFAITALISLGLYAAVVVANRERLLLDRLVGDLRRPRRVAVSQ